MSTPRLERTEEPVCTEIDLPAGQFPGGNARRRTATAADGQHAALVADACRLIEAADSLPDLGTLAQHAGLSPSHFHRVFKAQTGLTPKAYASAHRANRLAVAVPCHRVVRQDGTLSGYRWGIERKRELLRREKALADADANAPGDT